MRRLARRPSGLSSPDSVRLGRRGWEAPLPMVMIWSAETPCSARKSRTTWWLLSTKAGRPHWEAEFAPGDFLIFGKETKGLPEDMVGDAGEDALRIPMMPGGTRSLNLSTAVAIVLFEAVRQQSPDW